MPTTTIGNRIATVVRFDKPDTFPEDLRVAIVTDDAVWGNAVVKHFKGIGRKAFVVDYAEQLQPYLDEKTVDVILLDQPSDDLWDFCREAQKQSETMSPVLAVVRPDGEDGDKWIEVGADVTVPADARAPVDVEDFLRAYFSKIPDYDK